MFPGFDPLPWSTRAQIALDSARGLQYMHEHTVPVYIHRDIKSENILIDKNFCAKVHSVSTTLEILLLLLYFGIGIVCKRSYTILFAGCRLWINQVDRGWKFITSH